MKPIRLGIVGPGLIWRNAHEPALGHLTDRFVPAAFCASSEHSRNMVAERYPGKPFYSDYHEMLASPDTDAVVVLTPITLNAPVALAALQAGKDVILEKPMGRTLAEGQKLLETAQRTGKNLWVLEQFAYGTSAETARQLIADGAFGDVVCYERADYSQFDAGEHSVRGYGTTPWRQHPDFPIGTLYDGGHHRIAELSEVFGEPEWVLASGTRCRAEYGDYDHVLMHFGYASGIYGVFAHSDYLGGSRNHFYVRGTKGLGAFERHSVTVEDREGSTTNVDIPRENSTLRMWRAFADCYAQGTQPAYSAESAFRELRILHAISRSLKSGQKERPADIIEG